jgi:Flp pilus assembly pilin Flp
MLRRGFGAVARAGLGGYFMRKLFARLWHDDSGIVTIEYLILATVVGLSLVVGANVLAFSLNTEMAELAGAVSTLDQEYSYSGISGEFEAGTAPISNLSGANPTDKQDPTDIDRVTPAAESVDISI